MRALHPVVVNVVVWRAFEHRIPRPMETHPLGCHRPRAKGRDCFDVGLVRLVTGCSWEDAERLCGYRVSDTTARTRWAEWKAAGILDDLAQEALCAYDKIVGIDLSEVSVDGSLHKSPAGGEGTGKNPTDRAKLGWKWSVMTDKSGIHIGWCVDAANTNDSILLEPTLAAASRRGWLDHVETVWLDLGYDSAVTRRRLAPYGITDAVIAERRKKGAAKVQASKPMGLRWPVRSSGPTHGSRTSVCCRNTDRKIKNRLAQFAPAVVFMLTAKLIDWRNRWSRVLAPIH